jgi:hypothetical protein
VRACVGACKDGCVRAWQVAGRKKAEVPRRGEEWGRAKEGRSAAQRGGMGPGGPHEAYRAQEAGRGKGGVGRAPETGPGKARVGGVVEGFVWPGADGFVRCRGGAGRAKVSSS